MTIDTSKLGPLDADPNLVPFQANWKDNTGSIANAIFWLDKNWTKHLNAQGDFVDERGRHWFWNYGWATGTLLVHINGSREYWEIDREKMLHIRDGIRDNATIYRPFFENRSYGTNCHQYNGEPRVEWLKTREVVVVKSHHRDRFPLYLKTAVVNLLEMLAKTPFPMFPHVKLDKVLNSEGYKAAKAVMTSSQVMAYSGIVQMLKVFDGTGEDAYEPFHMHSYSAMLRAIQNFNEATQGQLWGKSDTSYVLFEEMNRLVKMGEARDAALVDALNFDRTLAESLEKTQDMVNANGGAEQLRAEHQQRLRDLEETEAQNRATNEVKLGRRQVSNLDA